MSLTPEGDLSEHNRVPTPRIKLDDEFLSSQQEKMNVYLRIRPLLPAEILQDSKPCLCVEDSHVVRALAPVESAKFKSSSHDINSLEQAFRFTQTFGPEVDQLSFFEETMKSTLEKFIQGQNELVFAYGSTGSGKTYTMQGGLAQPGIIPLTIQLLFSSIKGKQLMSPTFKPHKYSDVIKLNKSEREMEEAVREKLLSHIGLEEFDDSRSISGKSSMSLCSVFSDDSLNTSSHSSLSNKELSLLEATLRMKNLARDSVNMQGEVLFSIWVSFMEIYNETIYDLLEPVTSNKRSRLSLKEDENRNIYVKGLKEVRVTSSEEALKLFSLGKRNLRIASTKLNYQSSRSHCIFSIKVIRVLGIDSPLSARVNRLSYCDLAGSERSAKTQNTGVRLKEAGNINTSLLVLGRCIEALRQQGPKDKRVVPYRDSKLTRLFSAFFVGKGKASMIINVSPASHIYDETLNVLKFSALAKQVISSDLALKPLSHWTQEISRLTEAWEKSSTRWSSFCRSSVPKDSVDAVAETSMEDENDLDDSFEEINQRDQIIQELIEHSKKLSDELKKVLFEKENLEAEIRAQVCREFAENFVRIDNCYREQLKDFEETEVGIKKKVRIREKTDAGKETYAKDNAEDSEDDSDDEKGYTSAHEDTPPPVLSKAIEDSESETPEDKALKRSDFKGDGKSKTSLRKVKDRRKNNILNDNEAKKLETLLKAKDTEIEELRKRLEKQNTAVMTLENKLMELERSVSSKDADIDVLKDKLKENESAYNKEYEEYENSLILNGQQIHQLTKTLEEKEKLIASHNKEYEECENSLILNGQQIHQLTKSLEEKEKLIASHEERTKELENVISKKYEEINQMKKKMESEIASKDKEFKECVKTLNKRVQELSELRGKMDEMKEVISTNERKLDLKDVEIAFLAGNDGGSKENGIKLYEKTLLTKEEEISNMKKTVETLHFKVLEREKELTEYRNSMKRKDSELALMRKKLKENGVVVPKEDELNDYELKDSEISQLKKTVEKLGLEIASKEKEIEDFKSIVSLKTTEIYFLQEKLEQSEVIIAKPKELTESEALVKSQDQSITKLMKEVEECRKNIVFKDKELQQCKNTLNSREKELSCLKEKIEENEVVINKSSEVKEYKKSLNSKEAEVMKLKKKVDELKESVSSKEKAVKELEITIQKGGDILITKDSEINDLQKQVSDLRNKVKKSKDGKVKDENNIIKSQQAKIIDLTTRVDDLCKAILAKDIKIKEDNSIIKSQDVEIRNLRGKIEKLNENVSKKEGLFKDLEKKIKKTEDMLSSKDAEVCKLHQKIVELRSNKPEDNRLIREQGKAIGTEEKSFPEEIIELQQKVAEVQSKALESKAPEWEKIQQLTELVQKSSKTLESHGARITAVNQEYNEWQKKFEEGKKLIEEYRKKAEDQGTLLSKKDDEIKDLKFKLDKSGEVKEFKKSLNSKEEEIMLLRKKIDELEESINATSIEVQECKKDLNSKEAEILKSKQEIDELKESFMQKEAQSQEKFLFSQSKSKIFEDLVVVLQEIECSAFNRVTDLKEKLLNFKQEICVKDTKVQELISKAQEKEEEERLRLEKLKSIVKIEMEMQTDTWEVEKSEREVQTENIRTEEEAAVVAHSPDHDDDEDQPENQGSGEQPENQMKEEQSEDRVDKEQCEDQVDNEHCEEDQVEKEQCEDQVEKEQCEDQVEKEQCEDQVEEEQSEKQVEEESEKTAKVEQSDNQVDEEAEEQSENEMEEQSEAQTDSECNEKSDSDSDSDVHEDPCSNSEEEQDEPKVIKEPKAEDSDESFNSDVATNLQKSAECLETLKARVEMAECLVNVLQRIEHLATETMVELNCKNRNICKKYFVLSEEYEVMKSKLAAAEQEIIQRENECKRLKSEEGSLSTLKKASQGSMQKSEHLIEIMQKIEHVCTTNLKLLTSENLRLQRENAVFLDQVQAFKVELDLATQEIERKNQENCALQGSLRKKDARIMLLEFDLSDVHKRMKNLETKSKMQLLEEQTQHGIEVEQVMALKRQAETDYRSLINTTSGSTEAEETGKKKSQIRPPRHKGKKRASADVDKDLAPSRKRKMVRSQMYFEGEESSSVLSVEVEKLNSTQAPSSMQRLQEYVVQKSPAALKTVAHHVTSFLSPRREDNDSSTIKKTKKKLYSNTCVAQLNFPVEESSPSKISPRRVVSLKLRKKKSSK